MALQHQHACKRENFHVASHMLPDYARRGLLIFYDFARGADNIADEAAMEADDRRQALLALQEALQNHMANRLPPWARAYHTLVQSGGLPAQYGEQLLSAFIQDCEKTRYATMDELVDYCARSAVPVGRVVLILCREKQADLEAADALCTVLQLLNHMQDIASDYKELNRIYIPQSYLQNFVEADFEQEMMSEALCHAMLRVLDQAKDYLQIAQRLCASISSRRVRLDLAMIEQIAIRLEKKLRHKTKANDRCELTNIDYVCCAFLALKKGWVQ